MQRSFNPLGFADKADLWTTIFSETTWSKNKFKTFFSLNFYLKPFKIFSRSKSACIETDGSHKRESETDGEIIIFLISTFKYCSTDNYLKMILMVSFIFRLHFHRQTKPIRNWNKLEDEIFQDGCRLRIKKVFLFVKIFCNFMSFNRKCIGILDKKHFTR